MRSDRLHRSLSAALGPTVSSHDWLTVALPRSLDGPRPKESERWEMLKPDLHSLENCLRRDSFSLVESGKVAEFGTRLST